jgi:hypothetical protein
MDKVRRWVICGKNIIVSKYCDGLCDMTLGTLGHQLCILQPCVLSSLATFHDNMGTLQFSNCSMFDPNPLTRYIEVYTTGILSSPSYIIMQDWGIMIDMTQVSYHVSMTMGLRCNTSHLSTMERSTYLRLPSGSPSPSSQWTRLTGGKATANVSASVSIAVVTVPTDSTGTWSSVQY